MARPSSSQAGKRSLQLQHGSMPVTGATAKALKVTSAQVVTRQQLQNEVAHGAAAVASTQKNNLVIDMPA